MTVSWKIGYNNEKVVKEIESCRNLDDAGTVTFKGFGFFELPIILYSMLNFPSYLPEIEARRIVQQAIFKAGEKGVITPRKLLAEINKCEKEFLKNENQRYVLSTSLSIRNNDKLSNISFNNSILIFESLYWTKFQIKSKALVEQAKYSLLADPPDNYLPVRVHVSARSIFEASNKALDFLDLIRGIWNFYLNRQHFTRISSGKIEPVNRIISGPIHTIHFPNGKLASENNWWYEPGYVGSIVPLDLNRDLTSLYKFLKRFRTKLKKCNYSELIAEAIIRYTRALDERNFSYAFLKLWSVLELLTNSTQEKYEITIKRASFIFGDKEYHSQVLKHLREYRNSSVHLDRGTSELEAYLYQIKYYVEALLGFLIGNHFDFKSVEDVTAFLSLPSDDATLAKKIKLYKSAREYFGFDK